MENNRITEKIEERESMSSRRREHRVLIFFQLQLRYSMER